MNVRIWLLYKVIKKCVLGFVSDEIMHQDVVPLCATDIEDQLRKKFAYLSGKGKCSYEIV